MRVIEPNDLGIASPAGLALAPGAGMLFVATRAPDAPSGVTGDIELVTLAEDRAGTVRVATGIGDPVNLTFDGKAGRLLAFDAATHELIAIAAGPDGTLNAEALRRFDARSLGLEHPQGLTVDPASGRLFILDDGSRIVTVAPDWRLGLDGANVATIDLAPAGLTRLRGIAFDPTTGHLHVLDPAGHALHEVTAAGRIVATRDVSAAAFRDPSGMAFGPSGDATDDPAELSLYVADGRYITELSLVEPVTRALAAAVTTVTGTLVQTIQTSRFSTPSPDPSGIEHIAHSANLTIVDGEVEEMTIYKGANTYEMSYSGSLTRTWKTSFSNEPVGVAYNPGNRHLFVSDDNSKAVFEVDPGSDAQYGTSDDRVTRFDTDVFGSGDPEGITYHVAQGVLYIADGVNSQVYRVSPGNNGVFDGVAPAGDDQVTSFDTQGQGLTDPEGIAYDAASGHLYVVGRPENLVFHFTTSGTLLRTVNISAANAVKPAGLSYGPGSANPSTQTLWIVDRGVDNNDNPNENDGKVYEFSVPPLSGNTPPTVTITAPPNGSSFTQGTTITFTGTASDAEDGNLTASLVWRSNLDGTFGSGGSVSTSGLSAGTHTITASVTDGGGSQASASILMSVNAPGSATALVRVAASTDDAEESATGVMDLTSSDLEMVFDVSDQIVGMRFAGVAIPPGATITSAYVQFQVDEATSVATTLTIRGEATDNAATFASTTGNISSRAKTAAAVSWSPPAWPSIDVAGPDQQTPNLATIVQQIVNRAGWQSGNALVLIITGTGKRVAEAYNGVAAAAPLLRVDYTVGGSNTAPTASSVTISGTPEVGQVLTGNYTYNDADGDPEGTSQYRWLRNGSPIGGATARTYTLVSADQGDLIRFEVTPVAASGESPGNPVQSPAVGPVAPANTAPTASNVFITGTAQVGQVLTGNYTYSDADGDAEGASTYRWLRDGSAIGGATGRSYALVAADQGALIRFEVTPVAATGVSPGAPVQSAAVGPVAGTTTNSAPTATNVTISGTAEVGQVLTGNYTYSDADGDPEGASTYRWLRNGTAITGATARTYTLVSADQGTLIRFEVTPRAASGASPGTAVQSPAVGPVAAANTAPMASSVTISGTAQVGQVLTGNYTYSDADGDPEGTSTYRWLRDGAPIGGATARTYTLAPADQGTMIRFEVTPVAASGVSPGAPVQSPAVGPVAGTINNVPVAANVTISGTPQVGSVLTGNYTYSDADGDLEGVSTFRWLRNGVSITGAVARTYTLLPADEGALIVFEVTPAAATGASPGAPAQSAAVGPVVGPLMVTSITPNVMAAGSSVSATISGANFAPGATVTFEMGNGGPAPNASNVVVVDATTITATVTAGTGGPKRNRVWTVRVTNPGGATGVLAGGITITP